MKAIFIDAEKRELREMSITDFRDIRAAVADGGSFTFAMELENGDTIYVDDEGLVKNYEHFFEVTGGHQPFAGNGLVVGNDEMGESRDVASSIETLRGMVTFKHEGDIDAVQMDALHTVTVYSVGDDGALVKQSESKI